MSAYQAPKFEVQAPAPQPYVQPSYNYVIEPEPMPKQAAQPMWYPNFEVSAPIPVPQVVTQQPPVLAKVAIRNPEPMREP